MVQLRRRSFAEWWKPNPLPSSLPGVATVDLLRMGPEDLAVLDAQMEKYFSTALEMFPYHGREDVFPWTLFGATKPSRFFDFYRQSIYDRFDADQDLADCFRAYTDTATKGLIKYFASTFAAFLIAVIGMSAAVLILPALVSGWQGYAWAGGVALALVGLYAAAVQGVRAVYRVVLGREAAKLARLLIQRTQGLHKLFINVRALPDQLETDYLSGDAWGARAALLVRYLMWVGARIEFLEKLLQIEMWRLARERFWVHVGKLGFVAIVTLPLMAVWAFVPLPFGLEGWFEIGARALGALGVLLMGVWTQIGWPPPPNPAQSELGNWVRFGDLDIDGVLGAQVRRDKERLVEYRTLYKG